MQSLFYYGMFRQPQSNFRNRGSSHVCFSAGALCGIVTPKTNKAERRVRVCVCAFEFESVQSCV